jgi:predicted amidophosphoribosyltransferase
VLKALAQPLSSACDTAVEFLYPPACTLCEQVLPSVLVSGERDAVAMRLCAACRVALAPRAGDRCVRCDAPVGPYLDTSRGCIHCRSDRFAFERVLSLGVYEQRLRQAILSAKEPGGAPLATALAELLWQTQGPALATAAIDVVVPVPHHWTERLTHPHLPPATLAVTLARRLRVACNRHRLRKIRRTPQQSTLSGARRRENLRGAFRAVSGAGGGGTVLLVDDVLTTGTTAHRAAEALRATGTKRVLVAVIARAIVQQGA